jgi:hypothetical protein
MVNMLGFLPQETTYEMDIWHLKAELARIDILIRREVRRWQMAGQNPDDAFRGLVVSDVDAEQLAQMPLGGNWGQLVDLPEEEEAAFEAELEQAGVQIQEICAAAAAERRTLRLDALAEAFDLSCQDIDTFLICLAPALDLRYERLYGYLQDDVTRKQPSLYLLLNLLCPGGKGRWQFQANFGDDHPLLNHFLVEVGGETGANFPGLLGKPLQVDVTIASWLLGRYQPNIRLGEYVTYLKPEDGRTDRLLVSAFIDSASFRSVVNLPESEAPVIVFYGPDPTAQDAAARQLACQFDRYLLRVDLAAADRDRVSLFDMTRRVLRDARLTGAIPFFVGWDSCLVPKQGGDSAGAEGTARPAQMVDLLPKLLKEVCQFPGPVIIGGEAIWQVAGIERQKSIYWLEFPAPDYQQRSALWHHFLDELASPWVDPQLDIVAISSHFGLLGGQIRDAVITAVDKARQENHPIGVHDLIAAARRRSNTTLGALAVKIEPRYSWSDLILPADQLTMLHEIGQTVRSRALVLEEWEVGNKLVSSFGIPILFSGPPGTGKTMAAEVIAKDLELDLYKIDLSTIVSKYIGETEKNLEKIFNEAESSNAILFFDEADAIFGKRSEVKDAHDRYANIEVSYLLQRMERYNGVTILATNLRANLDEAFSRRLQFAVDFPFPDEHHRKEIWLTLFPPKVPCDPNLDFELLARRFRLAGGNIRNILVSAAYQAAADGQRMTMTHLLHGVRRELQKMGRLVNEKDMQL